MYFKNKTNIKPDEYTLKEPLNQMLSSNVSTEQCLLVQPEIGKGGEFGRENG